MNQKINKTVLTAKDRVRNALPVIAFFFFLYILVVNFFGRQYAVIVSVFTAVFSGQRLKDHTFFYYVRLLCSSYLLCFLAYVSSFNLPLCILLNFTVPFLLVFLHSSQFNPKGYFSYAMMFVFLEFSPPTEENITTILIILTMAVIVLAFCLQIYAKLTRKPVDPWTEVGLGLDELSDLMEAIASGEISGDTVSRLRKLELKFHTLSYSSHRFFAAKLNSVKLYDMFAILFQRASYLAADSSWKQSASPAHMDAVHQLALYVKKVRDQISFSDNEALIEEARRLLANMDLENGRLRIFFRSFLHMMMLILKEVTESGPPDFRSHQTSMQELVISLWQRCSLESFEMRFALRLSVVMTISYAVSYLSDISRAYWFPMNAFLMLMPAYEESDHRTRTRPIGTAIGCVAVYLILPYLTSTASQFIFALTCLSIMYCMTAGTWNQPIFATCYALTMTSMSIPQNEAITMRLLSVLAAMVLVYAVNHLVFPTSKEAMFRFNIHMMFRLHNSYWEIIWGTIRGWSDLSVAREILNYFHMVYGEAVSYLDKLAPSPQRDMDQKALITMWQVFSELEQIEFLIQLGDVSKSDQMQLLKLSAECRNHFTKGSVSPLPADFHSNSENGEDLTYVIRRYLANAGAVSEAFARFT